jgi:hypothetical protein
MRDRPQPTTAQQLSELIGIDLIARVPLPRRPAPIADDDPSHEWRQQVVQPLRLGAFLEGAVYRPAHPADELGDRPAVGGQHAPRDHAAVVRPHRRHRSCLGDVRRHILGGPFHESRSLLWATGLGRRHGNSKGRALNMR